jgi:hypothetical protein
MDSSLERIRAKIADLEVKLADLRIAERELMALERAPARKTTAPRTPKVKPKRTQKGSAPAHPTISAAIAEVLNEHGALPAAEIAEHINAGGREIEKRRVSYSLQALKKQGRVRIRGGKWMLPKGRSKPAST